MSDVTIASSEYIPAKKRLQKIAADAYQRAWDAKKRGEKIGWCASNFPQEIAETLDVCVVYPENQGQQLLLKVVVYGCVSTLRVWVIQMIFVPMPVSVFLSWM